MRRDFVFSSILIFLRTRRTSRIRQPCLVYEGTSLLLLIVVFVVLGNKHPPRPHGGRATVKEVVMRRRLEVNEMRRLEKKMEEHVL